MARAHHWQLPRTDCFAQYGANAANLLQDAQQLCVGHIIEGRLAVSTKDNLEEQVQLNIIAEGGREKGFNRRTMVSRTRGDTTNAPLYP